MPKETILFADDSHDILEGVRMILELKGFEVLTAGTEQEIDQILCSRIPDVTILDVFIAGQDGREICKRLKRQPETSEMRIILTSAASQVLKNYRDFGADDILEKPFGFDEIYNKVLAHL